MRILLEAEEEARASAIWYQKQFVGLGDAFLDDLESALRRIEDDPSQFPKLETAKSDRIKRCRFLRFPFYIVFEIIDSEIVVLAVAHSRRRPNYWRHRK